MASIQKKRDLYYVVYYYTDEHGERKQKWEPFKMHADAKRRKVQIEYKASVGTFQPPRELTVKSLMEEFITSYGTQRWSLKTYANKKSLINNYILPYIGDVKLDKLTTKFMQDYFDQLKTMKQYARGDHSKGKVVDMTSRNIQEIHKILRPAFNLAVKWEYIVKNPVEDVTLPRVKKGKRDIWTADILAQALEACENEMLEICMHLAFACSMRLGEILGATWDAIDISEKSISENNAAIGIDKQLQRVELEALNQLGDDEVVLKFPSILSSTKTCMVLKSLKTESSDRVVWIPRTVAERLKAYKASQDEWRDFFGEEYQEYQLVIAHPNGTPVEQKLINKYFKKLIDDNGFPSVKFHSLRHTSTTYKLKMNHGDIKAVQGDTGHAQATMVMEIYSHIIDEDRRENARKLDQEFYQKQDEKPQETSPDVKDKIAELLDGSPEMAEQLLNLLQNWRAKPQ